VLAGEVVYERKRGRKAALPAARHDDHGMRCYEGGKCCCVLAEELRAGQI
jgi:hypothetical protein